MQTTAIWHICSLGPRVLSGEAFRAGHEVNAGIRQVAPLSTRVDGLQGYLG
jgi:hypothetical protein